MSSIALGLCPLTQAPTTHATAAASTQVKVNNVVARPKKPETTNVGQLLKAGVGVALPQPTRQTWDEVFAPQSEQPVHDVTGVKPVYVEPREVDASNYELQAKLGSGSYGTVYMAREISTGRAVAVKEVVRTEKGCCVLSMCKLQQEIDVMYDLQEVPSVAGILGSYQVDDRMYIVMELCQGGDLENFLKSNGPLLEWQMAMVLFEALKMLRECHARKIVHGDVKAANFVISCDVANHLFKRGDEFLPDGWLKAIDFGTSQYTGKGRCTNKIGTLTHFSPEKFAGSYHTEADMWSLGVMMYRLMTGRLPFWDNYQESQLKSEKDVLTGVIYSEPDFTTEPWCRVSPECVDLMKGLLNRNYATRLTAESALNHPFITRHFKKRFGSERFEPSLLPSMREEYAALSH